MMVRAWVVTTLRALSFAQGCAADSEALDFSTNGKMVDTKLQRRHVSRAFRKTPYSVVAPSLPFRREERALQHTRTPEQKKSKPNATFRAIGSAKERERRKTKEA